MTKCKDCYVLLGSRLDGFSVQIVCVCVCVCGWMCMYNTLYVGWYTVEPLSNQDTIGTD